MSNLRRNLSPVVAKEFAEFIARRAITEPRRAALEPPAFRYKIVLIKLKK